MEKLISKKISNIIIIFHNLALILKGKFFEETMQKIFNAMVVKSNSKFIDFLLF